MYHTDEVAGFPPRIADILVREGRAELVGDGSPAPTPPRGIEPYEMAVAELTEQRKRG
jgi:hypothetical protein